MKRVLDWVKSNVVSVIFLVVMIAALVALPLAARRLNAAVKRDMSDRVKLLGDLRKLEQSKIEIVDPVTGEAVSETALVNEKLLERFEQVAQAKAQDAERVQTLARDHNQKGRGVLLPRMFPAPPPADRDVLPEEYYRLLTKAYAALLADVQAGAPPTAEALGETLDRADAAFRTQTLQKDVGDPLAADEAKLLTEALTKQRMSLYAEQADRIKLYAAEAGLNIPVWDQSRQPTMRELYLWQWQYWIVEDVVRALASANAKSESVQTAPVKRVVSLWVHDDAFTDTGGGGGGGGSPGPGMGSGRRSGGGGGAPAAKPANPATEVKPDFGISLTGRRSNALYDVRRADLSIVVDTARLPEVIDALGRQNFMTVLDVTVTPADHYEAARDGYFYGSAPVSKVQLYLETVWLRDWTAQFMPDEIRAALGVPAVGSQG